MEEIRCDNKHIVGRWVMCNGNPRHVHFKEVCPVCGNKEKIIIPKGTKVKCMKKYSDGRICQSPEYSWLVDGPPCSLNHIDVIVVRE